MDRDEIFVCLIDEIVSTCFDAVIITARSCDEALEKATQEKPSLIILDLFLHSYVFTNGFIEWMRKGVCNDRVLDREMAYSLGDGLKIASELKRNKETKAIPVLAMGTVDYDFVRAAAEMADCDGYLAKPFTTNEFVTAVKKVKKKTKTKEWVSSKTIDGKESKRRKNFNSR